MSKETTVTYWCDYTGNVARHEALIGIRVADKSDRLPANTDDVCVEHFCQHVLDMLRIDPTARVEIKVLDPSRPLELPKPGKRPATHGPCQQCGKSFRSPSGWLNHRTVVHPQEESV